MVDLGSTTGTIGRHIGNNGGVETLIQMELSEKMLQRSRQIQISEGN
jgi:hypothetical protein